MAQQQQKNPVAVLFESYGTHYNPDSLGSEEAGQLMRYCCGIIQHPETNNPRRYQKAKDVLIGQSRHVPNLLVGMLNDTQHLDVIVGEVIAEAIKRNPDGQFIDALARNAAFMLNSLAGKYG